MTTVRQIQRHWDARKYTQLYHELTANRAGESVVQLEAEGSAVPAAAMTLIRLDELGQSHVPLAGRLIRTLIAAQHADGGWGDPMTTALTIRALGCSKGQGTVIDRGLMYLANLQKSEGIWPRIAIRRMPADGFVSAYILLQLSSVPQSRSAIRFSDAVDWFAGHEHTLEPEARRIWDRAKSRCRVACRTAPVSQLWS
jgi:hypothetical protein